MKTLFKFRGLQMDAERQPDGSILYTVQDATGGPVLQTTNGQEAFVKFSDRMEAIGARIVAAYEKEGGTQ